GKDVVDFPAEMALFQRHLVLVAEALGKARWIVAGGACVNATHLAEKRAAGKFGFETKAGFGTKFRPMARAHVQEAVFLTPPRLVLAKLGAHDRELKVDLRVVTAFVDLVVGERRRGQQDRAPAYRKTRNPCRGFHHLPLLVVVAFSAPHSISDHAIGAI